MPSYTPSRPVPRPEPEVQNRPQYHPYNMTPENRPYNNVQQGSHAGGTHINPSYFATHYGSAHGFHFNDPANCCVLRGTKWYFTWNGGWFGMMGQFPSAWAVGTDYLYIDQGDDGNYYLYDAQFPGAAIQLTFVQNIGDDQAGDDQDQGD